jgi:hypothetical protein
VAKWVAALDDEQFAERERATQGLQQLEGAAEPLLSKALARNPTPEARKRLEALLQRLESSTPSPRQRQLMRAVAVLERVGTPQARKVLTEIADESPWGRLRGEANEALKRLAGRSGPR